MGSQSLCGSVRLRCQVLMGLALCSVIVTAAPPNHECAQATPVPDDD